MKEKLLEILNDNRGEKYSKKADALEKYLNNEEYQYTPYSLQYFAEELKGLFVESSLVDILYSSLKSIVPSYKLTEYKDDIQSLLHESILKNYIKSVEFLVEAGADIHLYNAFGRLPIHYAVTHSSLEIIQFILKNGAKNDVNANVRDIRNGNELPGTNLIYCLASRVSKKSRSEDFEDIELILKFLINQGADLEAESNLCGKKLKIVEYFRDPRLKSIIQSAIDAKKSLQENEVADSASALDAKQDATQQQPLHTEGATFSSLEKEMFALGATADEPTKGEHG